MVLKPWAVFRWRGNQYTDLLLGRMLMKKYDIKSIAISNDEDGYIF
jgi:hypothetical protein